MTIFHFNFSESNGSEIKRGRIEIIDLLPVRPSDLAKENSNRMNRNATIKLTAADKEAAKGATLGTHGIVQANGSL
jgi:uncharacterized protein with FMN-binding domain